MQRLRLEGKPGALDTRHKDPTRSICLGKEAHMQRMPGRTSALATDVKSVASASALIVCIACRSSAPKAR